jgi:4-cresol dehydrogenase (hydroxylating)
VEETCALVDLSGMNKIIALNEKYRYIILEAGVTQGQLYEALKTTKWMIPVTGSSKNTSVVGNLSERGETFFGVRNNLVLAFEVVLGNGELVKTNHWHKYEAVKQVPKFFSSFGMGPDLNGLFVQSSFGIITKVVIKLLPRKPTGKIVAIDTTEEFLPQLIESLKDLRDICVIQEPCCAISNNDSRIREQAHKAFLCRISKLFWKKKYAEKLSIAKRASHGAIWC